VTLTPETRVMLSDALRPPAGFRVETAVGTTYSLNLTAVLLAPLSFALFDQTDSETIEKVDPIRLLEAVRRHTEHVTVFCQAGAIHVPTDYRRILTFVEDSVVEVMPPPHASLFHPKVWALRFIDTAGNRLHRLVILSRNMTLDRSWDTALVLDEDSEAVDGIDATPAADFVRRLCVLPIRPLPDQRHAEIDELASTLGAVRLAPPRPFTSGELLPIGMTDAPIWPFATHAQRLLAISPFLTASALYSIARVATDRTLVSRAESLDLVGARPLDGWQVNVLQRLAETDPGEDIAASQKAVDEYLVTNDGLHAKTFVMDRDGGESSVVTGSANLTAASWGGGVEFDAVLHGPTSLCGVRAVLDGKLEAPGLGQLLTGYAPGTEDGVPDPSITTSYAIEGFHQQLAAGEPTLHVKRIDDEHVEAILTLTVQSDPPGDTTVWLASLASQQAALAPTLSWTINPVNITPFVAVQTTAGEGAARITRGCVLKATLTGDVDGRRQDAVFSILRSKDDVLRYLVFLLGDPGYVTLFANLTGSDAERTWRGSRQGQIDVALFEPLVRAMGRDEDALARVASLVEEIRALPDGDQLVPDGFKELWDVVWQVHQEQQK
jgi:hypothetical protein